MLHVVLVHPEIPPNTGNAMRLAANTGASLHLIEPLGFTLDDAKLRRAGMDYRDRATITVHRDLATWRATHAGRVFALAKSGTTSYDSVSYALGDALLFGRESVGLDPEVLSSPWLDDVLKIPMQPGVRSLNLSNSVAVVTYEAWRQLGFFGAEGTVVNLGGQVGLQPECCQLDMTALEEHAVSNMRAAIGEEDPSLGLRAVQSLRSVADRLEAQHVMSARRAGWTWAETGDVLGVSRQAVHNRYRKELGGSSASLASFPVSGMRLAGPPSPAATPTSAPSSCGSPSPAPDPRIHGTADSTPTTSKRTIAVDTGDSPAAPKDASSSHSKSPREKDTAQSDSPISERRSADSDGASS